jgi:hypothetical protein
MKRVFRSVDSLAHKAHSSGCLLLRPKDIAATLEHTRHGPSPRFFPNHHPNQGALFTTQTHNPQLRVDRSINRTHPTSIDRRPVAVGVGERESEERRLARCLYRKSLRGGGGPAAITAVGGKGRARPLVERRIERQGGERKASRQAGMIRASQHSQWSVWLPRPQPFCPSPMHGTTRRRPASSALPAHDAQQPTAFGHCRGCLLLLLHTAAAAQSSKKERRASSSHGTTTRLRIQSPRSSHHTAPRLTLDSGEAAAAAAAAGGGLNVDPAAGLTFEARLFLLLLLPPYSLLLLGSWCCGCCCEAHISQLTHTTYTQPSRYSSSLKR